jgi:[protein-PII] uridylyltransferase
MMIEAKLPSNPQSDNLTPESIRNRFFATGDASIVLAGRTEIVDRLVVSAWKDLLEPAFPSGMAVLAVGGYGREDLFPESDIDVLLLSESTPAGEGKEALSVFLRTMWDTGLRFSHSVRSPKECSEVHDDNVELNISLLDQRFLTGDQEVYQQFTDRLPKFMRARRQSLINHLCGLTRPRHAKYQDTIYHLEPNIKDTPGGMRDLHLLWWLNKLRDDPVVATQWLDGLAPSRDFLSTLRCYLHYRAGRDDNALSFDAQEDFTEQPFLPYEQPEAWMRHYFFHARAIYRAGVRAMDLSVGKNSSLLKNFRQWRTRLSNAEFTVLRERIFFKSPKTIPYDPELAIRAFQFIGRHGLKLSLEAERQLGENIPVIEKHYAERKPHWAAILEILNQPRSYLALTAMHETGVLRAVFPEWKRIECLVVRDFYHRYTVDEHSLLAIKALEDLRHTKEPTRTRYADLLSETEEPAILSLALIFHDIGKGEGDGTHADRSVRLGEVAMERIQLPVRKRQLLRFLVEKHLDLSAAMSGRDFQEPATVRALADSVGTVERLKALTLITYADICAVNPTAMSPWRLEQLWLLYMATYNELTRELETDRIHESRVDSPEKAEFLEGFPVRYLRTHSDDEIDQHLELDRLAKDKGVAVKIERRNGVYDLAIVANDRPFLLASVAGTLASFGLNIVKAEAFANEQGTILDTFSFEDPNRNLELNPSEVDRLAVTLERVALGKLRARNLLKSRRTPPRPSKGSRITPRVSINHKASETATLIELIAEDRPGLLYDVTRRISEANCNIEVILIDTEAHRAIDVIYVTYEGRKLPTEIAEDLEAKLLETGGTD